MKTKRVERIRQNSGRRRGEDSVLEQARSEFNSKTSSRIIVEQSLSREAMEKSAT